MVPRQNTRKVHGITIRRGGHGEKDLGIQI